jgi:hypothetical protein
VAAQLAASQEGLNSMSEWCFLCDPCRGVIIIIIIIIIITTTNGFLLGGSGTTIRHNTKMTHHTI